MEIAGAIVVLLIAFGILIGVVVVPIVMALRERRRSDRPFSISRTISATFEPIGRAPLPLLGAAVLLLGVPSAVLQASLASGVSITDGAVDAGTLPLYWGSSLLVGWTLGLFAQLFLVRIALDVFEERPVDVGAALGTAVRLFLPGLAIYLLWSAAMLLGLMLLIVPGLILFVLWLLAVPVLVAERPGILGALKRSAELTRGRRWRLFALVILFGVVASFASGLTGGAMGAGRANPVSIALVQAVTASFTGVLTACGLAAIYRATARDGTETDQLEEVFA